MLGIKLNPRQFLDRVAQELGRIDSGEIKTLADLVFDCYQQGKFVFLVGNGGSGSNCSHLKLGAANGNGGGALGVAGFNRERRGENGAAVL